MWVRCGVGRVEVCVVTGGERWSLVCWSNGVEL
jgi:hypothetical protein